MDWAVQDIVQGRWGERSAAFIIDFKVCSYFSFTSYYAGDSGLTISSMASLLTIPLPLRRAVMHGGQSKSRGFIHNTFTTGIFISYIYSMYLYAHIVCAWFIPMSQPWSSSLLFDFWDRHPQLRGSSAFEHVWTFAALSKDFGNMPPLNVPLNGKVALRELIATGLDQAKWI